MTLIQKLSCFFQQLIDAKLYSLLGERTAADCEKPLKKKKEKPAKEVNIVAYLQLFFSH